MKYILSLFAVVLFLNAAAQQVATFQVSGVCGMCKTRIEKAAQEAGAMSANWDMDTKQLLVTFPVGTTLSSIQQKVAAVGHDNAGARATDESYNKLHGCCKYERGAVAATTDKAPCCKAGETCKKDENKTAGSCCDKPCCKDGKCAKCGDCCKDGKCTKGGDCCKDADKANCCKDGKCNKAGHSGKDCCKKS